MTRCTCSFFAMRFNSSTLRRLRRHASEAERRAEDDLHTAWFHLLGTVVSG
jgi:hypothetical protein